MECFAPRVSVHGHIPSAHVQTPTTRRSQSTRSIPSPAHSPMRPPFRTQPANRPHPVLPPSAKSARTRAERRPVAALNMRGSSLVIHRRSSSPVNMSVVVARRRSSSIVVGHGRSSVVVASRPSSFVARRRLGGCLRLPDSCHRPHQVANVYTNGAQMAYKRRPGGAAGMAPEQSLTIRAASDRGPRGTEH